MKLLQIARIATKSKRDMRNLELITSSEKLDDLEFKMAKKYNCKIWRTELHKVIAYYCAKNNIDYGEYLAKGNNGIRTNKFLFDFLVKNLKKHNVNSIKKLKIKKYEKNKKRAMPGGGRRIIEKSVSSLKSIDIQRPTLDSALPKYFFIQNKLFI